MKNITLAGIYFLCLCLLYSCKPCNECKDNQLVKINTSDSTPPIIQWSISEAKTTGDQIISSIAIFPEGSTVNKNLRDDLSYNVYVSASDNESGIKSLKLEGGFAFTCQNNGNTFLAHGKLEKYANYFNFNNCALKNWKLQDNNIERYASCGSGKIVKADLTFIAMAENFAGKKDTSQVTVHFTPSL